MVLLGGLLGGEDLSSSVEPVPCSPLAPSFVDKIAPLICAIAYAKSVPKYKVQVCLSVLSIFLSNPMSWKLQKRLWASLPLSASTV